MKRSKLDIPHIKKDVIRRIAIGESQGSIAKRVGLSQSQISRFANREDIKPFIENEQMKLIEKVPDAVDYVKCLIPKDGQSASMDIKEKELAYKASHDVLKAVGIMPSPVQSQVIANIYNERPLISPIILKLLEERDKKFDAIMIEDNQNPEKE
jgi:transcriptional regulator with XRE-family HTH domain